MFKHLYHTFKDFFAVGAVVIAGMYYLSLYGLDKVIA